MPITLDPNALSHPGEAAATADKVSAPAEPSTAKGEARDVARADLYEKEEGPAASHDPSLGKKNPPKGRASGLAQIDKALLQANVGGVRAPIKTAPPVPPKPGAAKAPPPLPPRPGENKTPPPLPPRPGETRSAEATPEVKAQGTGKTAAQQLMGKVVEDVAGDYLKHGADKLLQSTLGKTPSASVDKQVSGGFHPSKVSEQKLGSLGTHRNVTDLEIGSYKLGGRARLGATGAELGQDVAASGNVQVGTRGSLKDKDSELSYSIRGGQVAEASHSAKAEAGVEGVKAGLADSAILGPRQRAEGGFKNQDVDVKMGTETAFQVHGDQSYSAHAGLQGAGVSLGGGAQLKDVVAADTDVKTEAGVAHGQVQAGLQGALRDRGEVNVGATGARVLHDMHAGASVGAQADGTFRSKGVQIGGERLDVNGQGQVSAKLLAEADVKLRGAATIQPPRACVDVHGKAFAGVKAEATGQVGLGDFVTVHGNADVRAGVGAEGVCKVGYDKGKIRFQLGAGWGSGVGAGAGAGVDVDVVKIGKAGFKVGLGAATAPVRYTLNPRAMLTDAHKLEQGLKTVAEFPQGIAKMTTGIASGVVKKVFSGLGSHEGNAEGETGSTGAPAPSGPTSNTATGGPEQAAVDVTQALSRTIGKRRALPMVSKLHIDDTQDVRTPRTAAAPPPALKKAIELLKD